MDFLNITDESEAGFKKIAEKLFNEFAISTFDSSFRLTEIEFYWTSSSHIDNSTYKRTHVDPNTGDWFFHYSGVDIALRNNDGGYGGILLRRMTDLKTGKHYNGPQVCAMRLFSGTNAFKDFIRTQIIPQTYASTEIKSAKRIGLGQNATENNADKFQYRFYI